VAQFTYQDRAFDTVDRPTFAEFAWIERQAKVALEDMTGTERTAAVALVALRRSGVMLTWADIMALSPADFDFPDEVEPSESDPTSPPESVEPEGNISTSDATDTGF
jgi:hypothetical protein